MESLPRILLYLLGSLVIIGTVLPLFNTSKWWVRLWDFPRFQILVIGLGLLALHPIAARPLETADHVFLGAVALACAWQISWIWRYLPLAPREAKDAKDKSDETAQISLLTSNVLQKARDADGLLQIIVDANPDLVLAVETDEWWCSRLNEGLCARYPNTLIYPLSNGFGLALFSRLELVDPEIRFIVDPSIPSLKTAVRLRCGAMIDLYGLHPQPPAPAQDSDERDRELVLIGREIDRNARPAVVLGDLNDVAWSPTTSQFKEIGKMLDPRRGRGFFNTYPAKLPGLRYPLDYVFHTAHFDVADMRVLPRFGSDHLPLLARLQLRG